MRTVGKTFKENKRKRNAQKKDEEKTIEQLNEQPSETPVKVKEE